jgi:hypothetical protein
VKTRIFSSNLKSALVYYRQRWLCSFKIRSRSPGNFQKKKKKIFPPVNYGPKTYSSNLPQVGLITVATVRGIASVCCKKEEEDFSAAEIRRQEEEAKRRQVEPLFTGPENLGPML